MNPALAPGGPARPWLLLAALLCSATAPAESPVAPGASPRMQPAAGFVGAEVCAGCHRQQYRDWQGSHHDLAMQRATEATVLGDFDDARFHYNGVESRFFRDGTAFRVRTDGPTGELREYPVEYTFGVYPLQQYLLALPGGRLNALSIAWDSRPADAGGQRWFHLYPGQAIDAADPLHWSGPWHNWNSRCAACHSTNLQKNPDPGSLSYRTTWSELDVACEACHGPGRSHVDSARADRLDAAGNAGFPVALAATGQWRLAPGQHTATNLAAPATAASAQVDSCGRCHSRRADLGEYRHGRPLLDSHRPSLLEAPLYHPDGQILDEVYVYGSFLQSKMYRTGVVCSDCHHPHDNQLRAPGNAVCAQCHRAAVFDAPSHHHHPAGSSGSLCANCHMPETVYMEVDPRRDHSMRIPRPDLSVALGTPNACNQCHRERQPDWALAALARWGQRFGDTATHPARALAQARRGDARAVPALGQLVRDDDEAVIRRATAMTALGRFGGRESWNSARLLLQSADPMLRMAAVRALEFLPLQQRWQVLQPLLADPSRAVRMELAPLLAELPLAQLAPEQAGQVSALHSEYLQVLHRDADLPGVQLQLAAFHRARRQWQQAESAHLQALRIDPHSPAALLSLADLYRALQRDSEARELLRRAITVSPREPAAHHALGLLETRAGHPGQALAHLRRAAQLEGGATRYRYVYAIALHDSGATADAIRQLQEVYDEAPENPEILLALADYCREDGRLAEARRYAGELYRLQPANPAVRQLYRDLQ